MKKIYKILLGVVLVFFILLISIPLLFQGKIIDLVKTTVNNNVNAQVDFSDANLSLIRNFPNASVQLSNVTVINNAPFKGDTLVFAKDILLKLKITDLLKSSSGQLSIHSFTIDNALVNVLVDEKGNANYDITIPSETTTDTTNEAPSTFGLSINSYAITNAAIKYNDKQGKIALELTNFNHAGSGDFSQLNTELDTQTTTDISFAMDGNSYAKNQKLQLDAILGMDLVNNKFSFLKNELKLNELPLIFDGYVQLNDTNQEIDLSFKTPSSDFKNFLGLIPQAYTKSIANVTTKGSFSVKGKVNGILDATHIPKLDIVVQSENASFKYPDLPKTVRNININAQVKNTTGKLENTFASINNLSFKIDEDTFSGKATAHNITTNPKLDATIKGTLNLAKINQAYPVNLEQKLSGILKANLRTQFDMNAIKNSAVNRIKNNGTIQVNDFVFSSDDLINAFHIKEAAVDFKPSVITLTKFNATTGKSDLNANGTLKNLLGFLLSDKKLQGKLNVNSTNLHINDFMQDTSVITEEKEEDTTTKEDTSGTSLKIPAFLDCTLLADAKTVHYDNLALKNVKGTLFIKDQKAILQNVTVGIFNGQIALNGEVNTQNKKPIFDMKLGIKSFDIAESFSSLELLQSLGLLWAL
ncbi:AsmA-like C-terminal region-containing protein [Tenacibaculum retecalamus]|uniref:AsmA-like C-terminal region-containing protein n=1 Tax=Tenacibaculum retecalamus TaxID=3018315 RepID=UPI0023D912C0|nr:AsmA-like C-terminal region-containing protein [Tenacibaculum retecalamus]WBX71032.1 AsmA family protein [Tenacibaculum retecalamus]